MEGLLRGRLFFRNPCEPIGISQFHVPGARPQDIIVHFFCDMTPVTTYLQFLGAQTEKKKVIPCFRGHPGILERFMGLRGIFVEDQTMELNRFVNPKQVAIYTYRVFYIIYS